MRYYSSTATAKTLSSAITSSSTQIILSDLTGLPQTFPYTLVIDPDVNGKEEIVLVTSNPSGTTLNVTRGSDTYNGITGGNGSSKVAHDAAVVVKHMVTARDLQEPQDHMAATTGVHGITGSLAPAASPTFTGTVVLPSTTSIGNVSSTEIGYLDGVTSAVQTQITSKLASVTGLIAPYLGTSAPTGWLFCNGAAVSRTTYADLFTLIGTRYGSGDGSTTFNLPDFRSKYLAGAADTATVSGTSTGASTHTHSVSITSSTMGQSPVNASSSTSGTYASPSTHTHVVSGTTASGSSLPPTFDINWIVKA